MMVMVHGIPPPEEEGPTAGQPVRQSVQPSPTGAPLTSATNLSAWHAVVIPLMILPIHHQNPFHHLSHQICPAVRTALPRLALRHNAQSISVWITRISTAAKAEERRLAALKQLQHYKMSANQAVTSNSLTSLSVAISSSQAVMVASCSAACSQLTFHLFRDLSSVVSCCLSTATSSS